MNRFSVIFNSNDKIYYDNHNSVCRLLGIKNRPRKATIKLGNDYIYQDDKLEGIFLWFPIMEGCKNKGWKNRLSEDELEIQVKPNKKKNNKYYEVLFITYGKFRINGKEKYRFLGIYKFERTIKNGAIFKKQANSFVGSAMAHT